MPHIAVISCSIREGRRSHRVARFFERSVQERGLGSVDLIDLLSLDMPIFHERLRFMKEPPAVALEFSERIKRADGVIVVTPEYNGGYPASLKNAVDLLYDEWHRKPVAISTVSDGSFGGSQVLTSLQFSLWKLRAWTVPALFPVPKVHESFDEEGRPAEPAAMEKRAGHFLNELLWCIEARRRMANDA